MTPSERVRAISEISQRLETQEWFLVDLTLSEFGAPTRDRWEGSIRAYVVEMLRGTSEETILELAAHVGYHVTGPQPPPSEPDFWIPGYFKLFISHTHANARLADELKTQLRQYAITGFIAHKDIEPSKEWVTEIELGLSTCDALACLLTDDFHPSNWTDQEVGFVLGRGRLVVPIAMPVMPYGFIQRIQAIQGRGSTVAALAQELFNRLRRNKLSAERIGDAIIQRFVKTESYAEARSNLELLRTLDHVGRDASLRLVQAAEDNSQLRNAVQGQTPIPALVKALVRERGDASVLNMSTDDSDIPF
jgi:hypothetical protein